MDMQLLIHLWKQGHMRDSRCVKQEVTAVIECLNGDVYMGSNWCGNPQEKCPRQDMPTGIGYEKCRDVCRQQAHAEVDACANAGKNARDGTLYLIGHSYCCDNCKKVIREHGIKTVIIIPAFTVSETL